MTDWNEILENIERAMRASERFQNAGEALVNHIKEDEIYAFAQQMEELQEELANIYRIIGPGSPIALDELAEAISQAATGKHAAYRMTPELPL